MIQRPQERGLFPVFEIDHRRDWNAGLLLENTAGERGDTTSKIGELAEIMENAGTGLISGICLDTCHAFASGYDLRTCNGIEKIAADISSNIGKERLRLIHLNDSKKQIGAGIDRHEHIGEGMIGIPGFTHLLNHPFFEEVPLILETPKNTDADDPRNLRVVRSLIKMSANEMAFPAASDYRSIISKLPE